MPIGNQTTWGGTSRGPYAFQPRSGHILGRALAVFALVLLGGVLLLRSCGSLPSDEVRSRILALPKNRPFTESLVEGRRTTAGEPVMAAHFPASRSPGAAEPSDVAAAAGGRGPIVLVHGTPDTMGAWEPLLFGPGALAGQVDVWAIEVLGHGMAATEERPITFQRCAEFVGRALEALELDGVTLVGNSYGGEFCWRAAAATPERIARLVLIDASGLPRADDEFLSEEVKMREWSVARFGYLLNSEARVRFALDPHFDGRADPGRVREVFLGLENRQNWSAMIDLVRDENGEGAAGLTQLAMPTLLLWGEKDVAYPPGRFGQAFEARIPDARLVVIDGAGHYPHEQDPKRVAREILAFHRADTAPEESR